MQQLQYRLQEYLVGATATNSRQYHQQMRNPPLLPAGCDQLRVHKSGVLAAVYDWSPDSCLLQTIRANNAFYGKPYFDTVAVKVTGSAVGNSRPRVVEAYAQLLLLFQFRMPASGQQQCDRVWRQLAFVKWFAVVRDGEKDPLEMYGATRLREQQIEYPVGSDEMVPYCSVVDFESLVRREYIVPDFY
jgi:hypothetical protein